MKPSCFRLIGRNKDQCKHRTASPIPAALLLVCTFLCLSNYGCKKSSWKAAPGSAESSLEAVALRLDFSDGQHSPLTVITGNKFRIDQLNFRVQVSGTADEIVEKFKTQSVFSQLNWDSLEFDQELWHLTRQGTHRQERYHHKANWMLADHHFKLRILDENGRLLSRELDFHSTTQWPPAPDDAFATRRFSAQAYSAEVADQNDLDLNDFHGIAAAQFRNGLEGDRSFKIPENASRLEVVWDHLESEVFTVPLLVKQESEVEFDYGLQVQINVEDEGAKDPVINDYFLPGARLLFTIDLQDRNGQSLLPSGQLPSYTDFKLGLATSGIQYYRPQEGIAYYLNKNDESNLMGSLAGPLHRIKQTHREIPITEFTQQKNQQLAKTSVDGYFSIAASLPDTSAIYSSSPVLQSQPISPKFRFRIPEDAIFGEYVFAVKVHRNYMGESKIITKQIQIQVGHINLDNQGAVKLAGKCDHCHRDGYDLSAMNHYNADLNSLDSCNSCHTPFESQHNNLLPYLVHRVHYLSPRYKENPKDCTVCHIDPTEEVVDDARWVVCTSCHKPHETHDGFNPFGEINSCSDYHCHHIVNPDIHILRHSPKNPFDHAPPK